MKARRTHLTDKVLTLPGGNEDNYLWFYTHSDDVGNILICSVWEPTDEERQRIADGENVRLVVWGTSHPPVLLDLTDEPLGKRPDA